MTNPTSISALTDATIAYLTLHAPWMADKVAGAVIAQPVRECWTWIKSKLQCSAKGKSAVEQLISGSDTREAIETLKEPLQEALQSDPVFAEKLAGLIFKDSDAQIVVGDSNKVAKITNSKDVSVQIG
jgi:hypothetical protein